MLRFFYAFGAFLIASHASLAQPFTVSSSAPSNSAVAVALLGDVCFEFSEAASVSEPSIAWFPADSVTVGDIAWNLDGRTFCQEVGLRPNTRYVALLLEAESAMGASLARPFALNFTTGTTNGNLNVSGTVSSDDGSAVDGTIVALLTGNLDTGDISIAHARVLDVSAPSQSYTVGPVPLGLYTVAAVRLPLNDAAPAFGFYDTDGDGVPNPILFPFNVNVTIGQPAGRTAADGFDEIAEQAAGIDPLAVLKSIVALDVDMEGAAVAWSYNFSTPAPSTFSLVRIGLFAIPLDQDVDVGDGNALPLEFADTAQFVPVAESIVGTGFRAAHESDVVTVAVEGTDNSASSPYDDPVWVVTFLASSTGGGEITDYSAAYFDFVSGELLGTTAADQRPGVIQGTIRISSSNPFHSSVRAMIDLVEAGPARVSVADAMGRTVAVLAEGLFRAGPHHVIWSPGAEAAAGSYWIRLQTWGAVNSIGITLAR